MNILAPVDRVGEIKILKGLGATEFYCGYLPASWIEKYNKPLIRDGKWRMAPISINKREIVTANTGSIEYLNELVLEAKVNKCKLYLTLNSQYYTGGMYEELYHYIREVTDIGIDGLIVSDVGLVSYIRKEFPYTKLILSCLTEVRNAWSAKVFRELGISRITFPRRMTVEEIKEIISEVPDMEYEVFVLAGIKCIYDNASCLTMHSAGRFCMEHWDNHYFKVDQKEMEYKDINNLFENENVYTRWVNTYPSKSLRRKGWINVECGVCSIPHFLKYSQMTSLKIEGRGLGLLDKVRMIRLIKRSVDLAYDGAGVTIMREYIQKVLPDSELCKNNLRCFMPTLQSREGE